MGQPQRHHFSRQLAQARLRSRRFMGSAQLYRKNLGEVPSSKIQTNLFCRLEFGVCDLEFLLKEVLWKLILPVFMRFSRHAALCSSPQWTRRAEPMPPPSAS